MIFSDEKLAANALAYLKQMVQYLERQSFSSSLHAKRGAFLMRWQDFKGFLSDIESLPSPERALPSQIYKLLMERTIRSGFTLRPSHPASTNEGKYLANLSFVSAEDAVLHGANFLVQPPSHYILASEKLISFNREDDSILVTSSLPDPQAMSSIIFNNRIKYIIYFGLRMEEEEAFYKNYAPKLFVLSGEDLPSFIQDRTKKKKDKRNE